MSSIINIAEYKPQKDDIIILDTNILIMIFYPIMSTRNNAPYIIMYKDIASINAKIYITSIQISEFVNRCIRFQYNLFIESNPDAGDFKNGYRETIDYRDSMNAILEIVSQMLSLFTPISDNFENMKIDNLLFNGFSYDFNDAVIAEISRNTKSKLITDDKDYANFMDGNTIITNNRVLLMLRTR